MLYFVPNAKTAASAIQAHPWLADLCPDAHSRETFRGPGDAPGLLMAAGTMPAESVAYRDDRQTWHPRHGSDVMIGVDRDIATYAPRLARPQMLPGRAVVLLDGGAWTIPRLQSYDAHQVTGPIQYGTMLPCVLTQDATTGRLVPGDVVPQYADVWAEAIRIGQSLLSQLVHQDSAGLSSGDLYGFAADVLAINYRVGPPEVSALRLLTTDLATEIVRIAIDWDTLREGLKKRLSHVSHDTSTASGATPPTAASSTPTDPPSPS